jgi:hypothetical protein
MKGTGPLLNGLTVSIRPLKALGIKGHLDNLNSLSTGGSGFQKPMNILMQNLLTDGSFVHVSNETLSQ